MSAPQEFEENGIGSLVAAISQRQPHKIAIVDGQLSISYRELHLTAQALSCQLLAAGLVYQDTVGIITRHGSPHIVAQLAIVYAGGTCLPLDTNLSDEDVQQRLCFIRPKYLLVDDVNGSRIQFDATVLQVDLHARPAAVLDSYSPNDDHPGFRSHILFSSGSTGKPKAIQVPGRGISRLARDAIFNNSSVEQRFGHINSIGFDVSLIDIWVALILGATIVVVDRQELLNPFIFAKSIPDKKITTMFITSSIFTRIASFCPDAFANTDTIMVGGELPSIKACKSILLNGAPRQLVNAYGPTECSILSSVNVLTLEDLEQGRMALGRPINQTDNLILDDEMKQVSSGSGELWLGGPGLSPGYLFNEEKTAEAFITMPDPRDPSSMIRLYRTSDVVEVHAQGYNVWVGRKNREVKIDGRRIQLDVVERELLRSNLIESAIAMKFVSPISQTSHLVACIVNKQGQRASDALLAVARRSLPGYMVPELFEYDQLPVNNNGKVDREEALVILGQKMRERHSHIMAAATPDFHGLTETERRLKQLWAEILIAVPIEAINASSDFFHLGGTSIGVATLQGYIRQTFKITLPSYTIHQTPILRAQALAIERAQIGTMPSETKPLTAIMEEDAEFFSQKVQSFSSTVSPWASPEGCNVLLTGVTGFVGAFLLGELLAAQQINKIRCLVRADTHEQASKRLLDNLVKYGLHFGETLTSKIEVVPGDFSMPMMGLDAAAYDKLTGETDMVYHLGARVDYTQPYSSHFHANVVGTYNMLQFCCDGGRQKAFHYVSSISAFGPTGMMLKDGLIEEDESLKKYLGPSLQHEDGYGQSQWVADEMVSRLMNRGFPAAIYRLGFVLCNSATGMGNRDDFMGRLLTDCAKLGVYPRLLDQRKEMIAVDNTAKILKTISMSVRNLGHAYHITPEVGTATSVVDVFKLVEQLCGVEMRETSYADWIRQLRRAQRDNVALRLFPLFPLLEEKVHGDKTRWELYEGMARFKVDNTRRALQEAGESPWLLAPVPTAALKRYMVECLEVTGRKKQQSSTGVGRTARRSRGRSLLDIHPIFEKFVATEIKAKAWKPLAFDFV